MKKIERVRAFLQRIAAAITPSATAWRGASVGVYVLVAALVLAFFVIFFIQDFTLQKLPAFLVLVGTLFLLGILALVAYHYIGKLAPAYRFALFVLAPFVVVVFAPGNEKQSLAFGTALILIASFVGAGIAVFKKDGLQPSRQKVTLAITAVGVGGLLLGLFAVFSDKDSANPLLDDYVLADRTLDLPNPGLPGTYDVLTLTYGSGKDQRRAEYGVGADLVARSVDGTKLIDNWDGFSGWLRTSYWGFDASQLPLQARVWYPDGEGPFPLVLVVHGNHAMEDFSDPGYAYLGELFASRGIIFASVDENYINFAISAWVDILDDRPGLKEENDARGWLLLQHLAQWRDWNEESGHQFENKVDMQRLALIGHSRGGEAVAAAAAFNALDRYPDDATLDFDFGFNLRGVIAIAPVDGQYQARDRGTPIRDVNYFTIHGSMDGDVQSFEGTSQYSRVAFSNAGAFNFRSSLYVTGANHGQFNTTWNNLDNSWFSAWALDLDGIMDGEAQRDIARVYFSAFLEVVLRDRHEYLPIFADARYAAGWLPETFYINQYANAAQVSIADFEEDIDPATSSLAGGRIETANLSKWYEVRNSLKRDDLDTHSVVLAWDKKFTEQVARVDFLLPDDWFGANDRSIVSASISAADIGTLPKDWEKDEDKGNDEDKESDPAPLDWSVELSDRNGISVSLPLSHDSALYPQVQAIPHRASFLNGADTTEVLFRRFELPVADFVAANPALDPAALDRVSFIFDRSTKGAIIVDDLSITNAE
jgi:dienelactone hydrolase